MSNDYKKVTGIGGIFFKSEDPQKTKKWYAEKLGLVENDYGSMFEFRKSSKPEEKAYLQWSPMPADTEYFRPSTKEFMINFRVENLERLIEDLREDGVEIAGEIQSFEYGKFAHVIDPEGNKVELWEPPAAGVSDEFPGVTTKD